MDPSLIGGLPRHSVFQPDFQGRREQIRIVQRCGGDIDGRWALYTFVRELAAACAAKLADDTLRGAVGVRVAR